MSLKVKKSWDSEDGIAVYTTTTPDGNSFTGVSQCHPDDKEFMSENFGMSIAGTRSALAYLRHLRDNEILPQIKILNHVYTNMTTNKKFNPKSYEATMVRRQLTHLRYELEDTKEMIRLLKDQIDINIKTKESFNKLERSKSVKS